MKVDIFEKDPIPKAVLQFYSNDFGYDCNHCIQSCGYLFRWTTKRSL